jgi:DNA processing protein
LSDGVRLSDEQRLDWLRLIRSDNIGPRTFRDLVNHYGGARAALAALPGLARRGGASRPARICSREDAEIEMKAAKARGIKLLGLGEPDYPQRLQMIDDCPPLLAVRGQLSILARPLVAIVGSRNSLWKAPVFRKCRCSGSRARVTFPAATGLFRACLSVL